MSAFTVDNQAIFKAIPILADFQMDIILTR